MKNVGTVEKNSGGGGKPERGRVLSILFSYSKGYLMLNIMRKNIRSHICYLSSKCIYMKKPVSVFQDLFSRSKSHSWLVR